MLDRDEQKLLLRDRPRRAAELRWSDHDLPLLDVARTLVDGPPRAYGHVIVDEAQDLSPMQLLMVSRRAVDGSLTMLGDVAQATGPVAYGRWQELEPYLPDDVEVRSRSCGTRTACRRRSWSSRCRCSTGSRPTSSRRSRIGRAATPPKLVRVAADELLRRALREAAASSTACSP